MRNTYNKQEELELHEKWTYVLLHAPETIKKDELGIDTLDLIRKTINEWVKEEE
jgi:hypothetical protein